MDKFTRNYGIGLGLLLVVGAAWLIAGFDYRARSLNALLADDPVVAGYVYRFRVQSVRDGVASMLTPRSAAMPAQRFLSIVRPELAGRAPDTPEFIAAEQELARVQGHARSRVLEQPDIREVRWVLDRGWYEQRGIVP